uniref:Uncharacterized protein n=2 Tax=Paramoeba aestuarina TaxID=180227 RepID=A0A7S4K0I0_9EUKA|mmetsp:Transcript_14439/g.22529  ORF Transcript_14439/g.22529 Transcript_14439/m.22529 type:complete len:496 (+) Transcript_14439:413-1900(+)|eukprot:CAMPEP_0201518792 /NCGR_PEP_ID=MMETSP0161_2-20130828/9533_1 /ASSEMBLY_ACC=CAM_ASM_000251 /TAXON_ID=180227 /ORGANISM="Neoparamoeba aestuarina, Strain SoJaBio B1-5/56/2" /LENGTH=495 /DNA_ID=CAMNT_0047916659 /DNA_START=440 /DNA_END=1927 /DNA_ORIENTATION=+
MSDNTWKPQDYASLAMVLGGGALFLYHLKQQSSSASSSYSSLPSTIPSLPGIPDIPLINALERAVQRDHLEFFFNHDEERKRGLTNHEPLTIIALAKLWNKDQTIPDDILESFHEDYKDFLNGFDAILVPPRSSLTPSLELPTTLLRDEEFVIWALSKRGGGTEAIDELYPAITARLMAHGAEKTTNLILNAVADEQGCLSALFHGFLLVCYGLPLIPPPGSSSSSSSPPPPSAPHLMVSCGLAVMIGRSGNNKGEGLFDHIDKKSNPADERPLEKRLDDLMTENEGDKLWEIVNGKKEVNVFPFGLVGALGIVEGNEETLKIWKEISGKHLSGANINDNFEELAVLALNYYVATKGCFVALHLVSAVFGLCRLQKHNKNNNNNNMYTNIAKALWTVTALVKFVADRAQKSEGATVWDRARGKNKPALEELEILHPQDPTLAWESLSHQAVITLRSHTIKLVFACRSLSEMYPDNNEINHLTRVAAYYAVLHATG